MVEIFTYSVTWTLQNTYISEWKLYSDIGIEITRIEIQ